MFASAYTYAPVAGPIPLHRYRKPQKTRGEERADRVAALAERLGLPRSALEGGPALPAQAAVVTPRGRPFQAADPLRESAHPNAVAAKLAIADQLGRPLARLPPADRAWIDALVRETLDKAAVASRVAAYFKEAGERRC